MTKGKHQFGAVGGNFLEMKERRNNMRMMASLPIVGACVGVVALFYWPEQIFDVRHMTGDPVATVVQEKISCPALQCCLPFLRPKTMIYDVTGMAANTPGQPPRDANAGTLMGSYFTPCFQDCCFHPCKGMLVHVRDENEKVLYRLVQDSCQPSILGGCCYLGCCYELHSEIHPGRRVLFCFLVLVTCSTRSTTTHRRRHCTVGQLLFSSLARSLSLSLTM